VLPVGLRDEVGYDSVKVFCPKCQKVYNPPPASRRSGSFVDGAAFGTTFPHLFLMTFSNLVPDPLPPDSTYIPRVFGFRVHRSAHQRLDRGNSIVACASSSSQVVRSRPGDVAVEGLVESGNLEDDGKVPSSVSAPQHQNVEGQSMKSENNSTSSRISGLDAGNNSKDVDQIQSKRKNSTSTLQKVEKAGKGDEGSAGSNHKRSKR